MTLCESVSRRESIGGCDGRENITQQDVKHSLTPRYLVLDRISPGTPGMVNWSVQRTDAVGLVRAPP